MPPMLQTDAFMRTDVVIAVDPQLSTVEAHAIADAIEALLQQQYAVEDSTIHIEPT